MKATELKIRFEVVTVALTPVCPEVDAFVRDSCGAFSIASWKEPKKTANAFRSARISQAFQSRCYVVRASAACPVDLGCETRQCLLFEKEKGA